MLSGTDYLQIASILLRFRLMNTPVVGDLEKAFLQISVNPTQRDLLRLLWPKDPFNSNEPHTLRFARVPFGLKASPFCWVGRCNFI